MTVYCEDTGAYDDARLSRNISYAFIIILFIGASLIPTLGVGISIILFFLLGLTSVASVIMGLIGLKKMASYEKGEVMFPALTGIGISSVFMITVTIIFAVNLVGMRNDHYVGRIEAMVAKEKKMASTMLNNVVRLDDVYLLDKKHLHYEVTLLDILVAEVDAEEIQATLSDKLRAEAELAPLLVALRKIDGDVTYTYHDERGDIITTVTLR